MRAWPIALAALLAATACEGGEGGPWRPGNRPPPAPGEDAGVVVRPPPPPRDTPRCEPTIGRPMLRRLTSTQLRNTLEDLFDSPDVPDPGGTLVDPVTRGYDTDARASIRDLGAEQIMLYAERVAAWGVEERLEALTSCTANTPICRIQLIRTVGRRLYRRPIEGETLLAYDSMFDPDTDFASGAEIVLRTMLQSPHFLYRMEIGEPVDSDPSRVRLTDYELATELAFLLTNSSPDDELLDAAGAGALRTDDGLDAQVDRLLEHPRAPEALARFARQWLGIDELYDRPKDPAAGELPDALRASMLRETDALFLDVLESGGGLARLFEARHTHVDGRLASFYGWPAGGDELTRVELDGTDRPPGVLGHASLLATHARADGSSPTQRGALVRRRILCESLPPPPPDVDTTLPDTSGARTTRERYARHSTDEACAGCHARTDPIGFALEHFDGIGRFRAEENGVPIDDSGAIVGTRDGDVPLDGPESLSGYLARSPEARACFAEHLAYWAFGVEGCTYDDLTADFDADTPLIELLRRLVHSAHFRERAVADGG